MTLRLRLHIAAFVQFFRRTPAPITVIAPDPVDDLKALRRYTGLSEIQKAEPDNLLHIGPTVESLRRRGWLAPSKHGYAFTFKKEQ